MAYSDVLSARRVEPAIMRVLLAIEAQATQLAPVDLGALRNSISVATEMRESGFNDGPNEKAPSDAKITPPPMQDGLVGIVGTAIVYGWAVEKGRPDMPKYPMQAFMRPAAMVTRAKQRNEFTKEMRKQIKDLANERSRKLRDK